MRVSEGQSRTWGLCPPAAGIRAASLARPRRPRPRRTSSPSRLRTLRGGPVKFLKKESCSAGEGLYTGAGPSAATGLLLPQRPRPLGALRPPPPTDPSAPSEPPAPRPLGGAPALASCSSSEARSSLSPGQAGRATPGCPSQLRPPPRQRPWLLSFSCSLARRSGPQ